MTASGAERRSRSPGYRVETELGEGGLAGSVVNLAGIGRDGPERVRGAGHVGLQGAAFRGRDRALGGPMVLPLRRELSRSRADDGASAALWSIIRRSTAGFKGTRPRSRSGSAGSGAGRARPAGASTRPTCQSARERDPGSARNRGSDAGLVQPVKRLATLTPDRRPMLTPAEVVPVVHRRGPRRERARSRRAGERTAREVPVHPPGQPVGRRKIRRGS